MSKLEAEFPSPETHTSYSLEELEAAEPEEQKEIMRHWFWYNYYYPVERTPYESREGGYIYIWGGPYDAEEVLYDEFGEYVPHDVIQELIDELEEQCIEWTSAPSPDDYDEYYSSVILSNTAFHKTFLENLEKIKALLGTDVDAGLRQSLLRLLFVNIITALETFLSDAFINTVLGSPSLIRKFVETNPDFAKQKFSLNDIFNQVDTINDEVKKYLLSQIWHNIEKIKPMYESALEIKFTEDLKDIFIAIIIRHDIVHRNGKTKNGDEMVLTDEDLNDLMEKVRIVVDHIDNQFCEEQTEIPDF